MGSGVAPFLRTVKAKRPISRARLNDASLGLNAELEPDVCRC